jgi:pimeloyl-ACP methyl ester carboxylesterase
MKSFVTVHGLRTAYRVSGAGENLLMLHGWGCNMQTMLAAEQHLSQRYKVWTFDFPGFGESEEPKDTWGTFEYADFVIALAQQLGIESPVLLGHSFGGRVSIVLAEKMGVQKMVLVGSAGIKPVRSWRYYAKVYSYKAIKKLLNFPLWKRWTAPLREKWLKRFGSADYQSASDRMRQILSRVVNEDLQHLMPRIQASTLLIWGDGDTATPLSDGKKMEKLIPGAGLAVMQGCGHYCFLEKPQQFARILDAFLNG